MFLPAPLHSSSPTSSRYQSHFSPTRWQLLFTGTKTPKWQGGRQSIKLSRTLCSLVEESSFWKLGSTEPQDLKIVGLGRTNSSNSLLRAMVSGVTPTSTLWFSDPCIVLTGVTAPHNDCWFKVKKDRDPSSQNVIIVRCSFLTKAQ